MKKSDFMNVSGELQLVFKLDIVMCINLFSSIQITIWKSIRKYVQKVSQN